MSDDDELFRRAMAGVRPLADRSRKRREPPAAISPSLRPPAPVRFEIDGTSGRAPGVSRAQLSALARGEPPIDERIDLHGLRAADAAPALETRLAAAIARGARHVLVIHGRGNHSIDAPVLPGMVVDVLTRGASAGSVLGFCRARPQDGGDGATCVLLRQRAATAPIARFAMPQTAGPDDIDELGHVSNLVYLRWVLEVAVAHSDAAGFDAAAYSRRGEVFVVRRHEIDYLRPVHEGRHLSLITWVDAWDRASCLRRTDIASDDGALVFARATTRWALISIRSGRPVRIGEDLRHQFGG